MARLLHVGPLADAPNARAGRTYLDARVAEVMKSADVDAAIASRTAGYADVAYVDAGDAGKATKAYVDQQDALQLKSALKGQANGPVALNANGMISGTYLSSLPVRNYGYLYGFDFNSTSWASPTTVTSTSSMLNIGRLDVPATDANSVPRLGNWMILVWGTAETTVVNGYSTTPYIEVRQGGTSGAIVARGYGSNRADYHMIQVSPYNPPVFAQATASATYSFYFYARIASAGRATFTNFWENFSAMVIPC